MNVGRIVASVTVENAVDLSKALTCDALVDTGASLNPRFSNCGREGSYLIGASNHNVANGGKVMVAENGWP